jgi:hypothetical protein
MNKLFQIHYNINDHYALHFNKFIYITYKTYPSNEYNSLSKEFSLL